MKKKNVFLNKHHIKNKNFQRKKQKYFTDKKFLRKFKKIKELNEPQTEIVKSDPIKNFFFTPTTEADKKEENTNEDDNNDTSINNEREIKASDNLEGLDSESDDQNVSSKYNNTKKKGAKTDIYRKELSLVEKNKQGQLSKEEKEELFLKKKQEKDEKKKIRFQKFKRLNQKTKKGQPVMKNLINHLIKKI
ncbi:conserved Plasmodium protein, unknown function [Plasmodium vinckei]|uniref:Uncharacterized protein n=1 Tax=Plasmodium vinckei TaxID=5860 RepID=A0A6V7TFA3_PLAVN|nr:conserved Plasmodium protein, unknown function [Plasmodium vinckei]